MLEPCSRLAPLQCEQPHREFGHQQEIEGCSVTHLDDVTPRSMNDPALHAAVIVVVRVVWAADMRLVLYQNYRATSCLHEE